MGDWSLQCHNFFFTAFMNCFTVRGHVCIMAWLLFVCVQRRAKEVSLLDRPALLKKIRGLLDDLSGRVAGRNKDDVIEARITVRFCFFCITWASNSFMMRRLQFNFKGFF